MHPEARLHALARQADAGQAPKTQELENHYRLLVFRIWVRFDFALLDPDP